MAFTRKDLHKKKRLTKSWRRPKGLQNKLRLGLKAYGKKVKPGYGTKNSEKNTFKGKDIVHVSRIEDLQIYDAKKEALNIASVSKKNKVAIIKEAKKKGFSFVNFDADKYLKKIEEEFNAKKSKKKAKQDKKATKKSEETSKKKEEKTEDKKSEKADDKKSEESQEKKEKDKVLTKSK